MFVYILRFVVCVRKAARGVVLCVCVCVNVYCHQSHPILIIQSSSSSVSQSTVELALVHTVLLMPLCFELHSHLLACLVSLTVTLIRFLCIYESSSVETHRQSTIVSVCTRVAAYSL